MNPPASGPSGDAPPPAGPAAAGATAARRPAFIARHRPLTIAALLALGTAFSIAGFSFVRRSEERRIAADFEKRAAVQVRLARERLQLHEELVRSLRTYVEHSAELTGEEFQAYAQILLERLPAARVFQWAPRVPQAHRAEFEAAARRHGAPDFRIWEREVAGEPDRPAIPARDRPEYWPILWIAPLAGHEASLGFDLNQSVVTRPMLDRARAERRMMLSPQVRLIRSDRADRGSGVIFIEPVFRPRDPAADRDGFAGYLQAIFSVDRLLAQVHADAKDDALDIAYYDDSAQFAHLKLLYARIGGRDYSGSGDAVDSSLEAPPSLAGHQDAAGESFRLGAREWRIVVAPNPAWLKRQRTPIRWFVLAGELALTGLAALFVNALLSRTERTEKLVARRTAELAESRRQLAALLADMPGAAYRCAPAEPFSVFFVSDGIEALTGFPARDFIVGERRWSNLMHPDDLPECNRRIAEAIEHRTGFELEYRLSHRDGRTIYVWERGHAIYRPDGKPQFLEGLTVDATARREAEARAREFDRQLLETQKLESLGVLAGGIAHDFNNILTGVLGHASIARYQLPPGSPLKSPLDQIEHAARRAADLCAQMLAYAGRGSLVPARIDLGALVRDTAALLEVSLGKGTRLHLHLPVNLPAVQADASQLRQIVMNLVINSAEAIGARQGAITVSAFTQTLSSTELRRGVQHPDLPGGVYVGLEVRDNGGGMPPETLARIFEPFFTTKFSGRGLGLSAVLGIVRRHRGALFVESTVGHGTSFRLFLPAASETTGGAALARHDSGAQADSSLPQLRGTVLVVDDESTVREMATLALRHVGLEVLEAADGFEALALCREHAERIDVVLLDLTMPNLSGEETLRRLRMQGATQKVILMSGFSASESAQPSQQLGAVAFLGKPFEIATLVQLIARHLR